MNTLHLRSCLLFPALLAGLLGSGGVSAQTPPDNSGPVHLLAASRLAGQNDIVGVQILPDGSLLLASRAPGGQMIHLDPDGQKVLGQTRLTEGAATLERMKAGPTGEIYLLGSAPAAVTLAGTQGSGRFIARLLPDGSGVRSVLFDPDALDFSVDTDGALLVLSGQRLIRYSAAGQKLWEAAWPAHGRSLPQALALSPGGVAVVLGFGMTGTGHEPYKDPYAAAFDRAGQPLWTLWNPDPHREAGSQYGGNGLMADTTGHAASVSADGRVLLLLYADGGNTVAGRDPSDPDKPLDPAVTEGVFQSGPGYGFHGASKTSLLYRVDAATGKPEKATWMCAWQEWPQRTHAGTLRLESAAGDEAGHVFAVGDSAYACPILAPWYVAPEGAYKGGGFLAVFDRDLKMQQCGAFLNVSLKAVACRGHRIVAVGSADGPAPVPQYRPVIVPTGGGDHDGYLAIFQWNPSAK